MKIGKAVFIFLAAAFCAGNVCAQISISAETDKTSVALNESVSLSVTVSGAVSDIPDPEMPSMPNFNIYSSGRSQSISVINGKISSNLIYNYALMPRFVGKALISPIVIKYGGQTFQTRPVEITVTAPSATSQTQPKAQKQAKNRQSAGNDAFVTAEADRKEAYINEQINLSIKFYTAVPLLGNPDYSPPSIKGFLSEDLPPVRTGEKTIDGKLYYFSEIKAAIFGAAPGKAVIGPAIIRYQAREDAQVDPFEPDFFQKFFAQGAGSAITKEVRTEPIEINIKPLPDDGKPLSFNGA
ncbi:MAG: BatD family protein, partial [Elusimicrobia bacterium]|nr:BatD family protein [Elusimicrobiota bacterium]